MPAIGNVVINDGMATPVARTFSPVGIVGNTATLADRSGGIPVGYGKLVIQVREAPNTVNGNFKVAIKILTPTLEQTSPSTATGIQPAPSVAYTTTAHLDLLLPARGTQQDRKNLRVMLANALASTAIIAAIENLESVY